jgi:dihydroflavonol-4-reductase
MHMSLILVTGGSGFIAGHLILRLLADGHRVRSTVRSDARGEALRTLLRSNGAEPGERLEIFRADLLKDDGWREAATGCDYIFHTASPFPLDAPKDEDELITPARDGTLRVLRAARDAGAKRIVVTSSFAAIGYGHPARDATFTEADWTVIDGPDTQAYMKSKTLAERAAWDFIAREGGSLELATVNPVAVFGPALGADLSSSVEIVRAMLTGEMPAAPKIHFGIVDVRDVVDLHIRAMFAPEAKGERFLAVAGETMSLMQIAQVLKARFPKEAAKAPGFELPNWLLRVLAVFVPFARTAVPHLGVIRQASNDKARRLLAWSPRTNEEAIVATAESLIRLGLVGK